VIIVDDRLAAAVLAGRPIGREHDGDVATTWGFHHRLVRALGDDRVRGRLTGAEPDLASAAVRDPERHGLRVIDPRTLTASAVDLARDHRLNLLAAELFAAALLHRAAVALSPANVGRGWPDLFADLSIPLLTDPLP
jgi:hypothetical protein